MSSPPHTEYHDVELPLIRQLQALGWDYLPGDIDIASNTERATFKQVLLVGRLRAAIRRINPWLDDERITQMVGTLGRLPASLMKANETATGLLLNGTVVPGLPDRDGGRDQTAHYIDWEHIENNDFLVINQFRVNPPWATGNKGYILPDLVLFVNGVPLVVIECKARNATAPRAEAIAQLRRYANLRGSSEPEGAERLFYYNLFMVATFGLEAHFGTISSRPEHYLPWKDTTPAPMSDALAATAQDFPAHQGVLAAGLLRPAHLLDLLQNFTIFKDADGQKIKIVGRYQQFRAVHKAIARLQTGATRLEDGDQDQRGGIIWHTQGAGKSLTMVFLVRKMRHTPDLRRFKVVVVTDRQDLEDQLSRTAALSGKTVKIAQSTAQLKQTLRRDGPHLVFAMIQKYQHHDQRDKWGSLKPFPELNASPDILLLVDEAHRSHTNELHANMMQALPNSARIGFTGTPIMVEHKKQTAEIFGPFIDTYNIAQSVTDGVTVPILYEGRMAEAMVAGGGTIDDLFEQFFTAYTEEQKEQLKAKYATDRAVLEARELIEAKAADMLRHYVRTVLPDGFKAQVVTVTRLAAVRYQAALERARDALVAEVETMDRSLLALDEEALKERGEGAETLVAGYRHLARLKALEFAAVISGNRNKDPTEWRAWTDRAKIDTYIDDFKKAFEHKDPRHRSPLAFLCVQSMLLTGFDAPVEQVMYLDRPIREHDLLQAIARVNRVKQGKKHGLVVDYYGVTRRLEEALAVYSAEDVVGALTDIREHLPILRDRYARVMAVFRSRGIDDLNDIEACVALLHDERLRAEFVAKLKLFTESLDIVMPRPEALPYLRDARLLGHINKAAANLYRDPQLELNGMGDKVRHLIDDFIQTQGVDPKIPPVSIMAAEFLEVVNGHKTTRTKALEMAHAARHHIDEHYEENPVYYRKLRERLEAILSRFEDNWEAQHEALSVFINDVRHGPPPDDTGLDPQTEKPFFSVLEESIPGDSVPRDVLVGHTRAMIAHIRQEVRLVDFWQSLHAQDTLRHWIRFKLLDRYDLVPYDEQAALADQIMQIARRHNEALTQ